MRIPERGDEVGSKMKKYHVPRSAGNSLIVHADSTDGARVTRGGLSNINFFKRRAQNVHLIHDDSESHRELLNAAEYVAVEATRHHKSAIRSDHLCNGSDSTK